MTIHTNQFKVCHRKSTGETNQVDITIYRYLLQSIAEQALETIKCYEIEDIEITNISSKDVPFGGIDITCNIKLTNTNYLFNLYSNYRFDCKLQLTNIETSVSKTRIK